MTEINKHLGGGIFMTRKGSKYIIFTFIFSWIMWGILGISAYYNVTQFGQPLYLTFFILGGSGPFIVAFFVNLRGKKEEYKEFLGQLAKVKVNPLWYLYVLIMPLLYFSIPWIINILSNEITMKLFKNQIYMVFAALPLSIVFGGSEELGWRGVLLPELLNKFSKINSTLILGTIWGIWHLPLFFIKGAPQENGSFIFFFIGAISLSFFLTTIYTKTKSIFLCILFHAFVNSYPYVINIQTLNNYRETLIMLAFSILVFYIYEKIDNKKSISKSYNLL